MTISFYTNYICPLDEASPNPIFGRIDEEDTENGLYLVANYTIAQVFLGYLLMDTGDLKNFRIFKGKQEFKAYVTAHFTP